MALVNRAIYDLTTYWPNQIILEGNPDEHQPGDNEGFIDIPDDVLSTIGQSQGYPNAYDVQAYIKAQLGVS